MDEFCEANPSGDENLARVKPTLAEVNEMDPGIMGSKVVDSNIDVTLKTDAVMDECNLSPNGAEKSKIHEGGCQSEIQAGNSYADMVQKAGPNTGLSGSQELLDRESELLASFKVASLDEERFLKHKLKVHWLAEGDANTKYFHNTLKCRNHRARIDVITDSNGILHEGKAVPKAFVDHYVGFLGKEEAFIIPITQELFDVRIDQAMSVDMIREVTLDEIKRTIFAFADDKAPGPDGFTPAFYKKAWDIVGKDICLAV
ncbi:hypothetical protein QVD17_08598 [Tagetes erecta]|uniref:Reverse transcriptase n=1 Tax=Tagetes erecta TaxID=13708 RepID=A0AAD8L329_TARER|nr:hypothetical protein QVD17_08598 [Tagetes erecta]